MIDEQQAAPLLFLPIEITTEIFKQAIWVDVDDFDYYVSYSYRLVTPLTLGAVCRSWRAFVWDAPSLWTIIVVTFMEGGVNYRDPRDILDLWLKNSGACPLEVFFHVLTSERLWPDIGQLGDDTVDNVASVAIIMLQELVKQSHRWKKINFRVFDMIKSVDVLRQVKGRLPLLEMGHLNQNPSHGSIVDMFQDAPLLKRFTLSELRIDSIVLPWKQLTSFRADFRIREEECIEILSQCTNLIECAFSCVIHTGHFRSNGTTIFLPYLRSFSITHTDGWSMGVLLKQQFQLPKLRQLVLSTPQLEDSSYQFPHLQLVDDFITRSDCVLEVLSLDGVPLLSLVIPILERLPSLQYLTLRGALCYPAFHNDVIMSRYIYCKHEDTDSLFDALLSKLDLTNTPIFLPNLRELDCQIPLPLSSSASRSTSRTLLNVLKQRWCPPEGVSKLRKLVVEDTLQLDSNTRDGDFIDGLRELERQGMEISVPYMWYL